jgi:hypothetical protein
MKQILFWKYADIAGQALMLLPLLYLFSPLHRDWAFTGYFSVGAWQTLSCVITAAAGAAPVAASRRLYGSLLTGILALFTLCSLAQLSIGAPYPAHGGLLSAIGTLCGGIALVEATFMLFLAPVMAVWYAMITLEEIASLRSALNHRAEIHWKL